MFINFVDYFLYSYISILNCFSILLDRCFVNKNTTNINTLNAKVDTNVTNITKVDNRVTTVANQVNENAQLTKAVGTLALENHEKVSVLGLQVNKNTEDISNNATAIANVNTKVDENVKLTKNIGAIALENNEKVNVLGLQVNKNTQDISTLAEAANYSLKASNIALQDHATLVQHDAQIAENSRRISSVERDVKVVGANAAALAALKPIEYHEGQKAQIMAAVGTYKGKTSTALGVAHYANPDLLIHAGAAYGGDHSVMANAGVTIGIGNAPTAPKASPATVKVLEDKVADLQAQNKEIRELLDKVIAQQPQQAPKAAVKTTK